MFLSDVWLAFLRLPRWVQFWGACLLVPVNLLSILFVYHPGGWLVFLLAVGGMVPNALLLVATREFGREMAISHLVLWVPLVAVIIWLLWSGPDTNFASFLWCLLVVDVISIAFDVRETLIWWRARNGNEVTRP